MASDFSQWVAAGLDQLMDLGMDSNSPSGSAESKENKTDEAAVNNTSLGETASPPCFKPTMVSSVLLCK